MDESEQSPDAQHARFARWDRQSRPSVERFDSRRGLKLSTYAVWWIRRSILDAIAEASVIRIAATVSTRSPSHY